MLPASLEDSASPPASAQRESPRQQQQAASSPEGEAADASESADVDSTLEISTSPMRTRVIDHSRQSSASTPVRSRHLSTSSVASTVSAPPSPSARLDALMTLSASSSQQQHMVLHGGELVAFTSALREFIRTNEVRAARQAALNETNAQLHAMNFFMAYVNAERSQKLEQEYSAVRDSIESGRLMLAHMSSVIASQEEALSNLGSTVTTLSERTEEQSERVNSIEDAMAEQKVQLALAMAEYEARLSAQEAEFRRQEAILARLLSVRFKLDFGLDMLLLLVGWYGSHNGVTSVGLEFLSQNVFFRSGGRRARNRRARAFVGICQFVAFMLLVRKLRQLARESGLHHAIGGYAKYAQFFARTCGTAVEMVRGGGTAATALDEEDQQRAIEKAAAAGNADSASAATAAVPPEYSTSAAATLGRTVGAGLLSVVAAGRDSLRFVLRHVVATGAHEDEEATPNATASATAPSPNQPSSASTPTTRSAATSRVTTPATTPGRALRNDHYDPTHAEHEGQTFNTFPSPSAPMINMHEE